MYSRIILPVPHLEQQQGADCLPACAAMVLAYLGKSVRYRRLLRILQTQKHGTPFPHIKRLERLNVDVTTGRGTIDQLYAYLSQNQPAIVSVATAELPYWTLSTDHAIVVIGMDENSIYVHDPAFTVPQISVPIGEFDLAWLAKNELYAVITT